MDYRLNKQGILLGLEGLYVSEVVIVYAHCFKTLIIFDNFSFKWPAIN